MDIDKQRIAAVRTLEAMGYSYRNDAWLPSTGEMPLSLIAEADAIHKALVLRADALEGCTEGSEEEAELKSIVDVIEAFEAKRWPLGKEPGGKG